MGSGHQLRFISWWECPVLRCGLLGVSEIAVMRSPASVRLGPVIRVSLYKYLCRDKAWDPSSLCGRVMDELHHLGPTLAYNQGSPGPQPGWSLASIMSRLCRVFRKSRKIGNKCFLANKMRRFIMCCAACLVKCFNPSVDELRASSLHSHGSFDCFIRNLISFFHSNAVCKHNPCCLMESQSLQ